MRKKRYNKKIRSKTKWRIGLLTFMLASLFIIFKINEIGFVPFTKYVDYQVMANNMIDVNEDVNFFYNELFTENKKVQMFLVLDPLNFSLRDFVGKEEEVQEVVAIPAVTELQSLKQDEKLVYLTFDDGPSAYTNEIIDLLEAYDMKATFFMLEPRMRKYPESVHYLINKGHQPALHGVTHRLDMFYESKESVVREMDITNQTLFDLTGLKSSVIRTPYGSYPHMKEEYFTAIAQNGYFLFDWTVDSLDWKYTSEQYVWHTIQQLENEKNIKDKPKVILLHDRESTYLHLEKLLVYLKMQGYSTDVIDYRYLGYSF